MEGGLSPGESDFCFPLRSLGSKSGDSENVEKFRTKTVGVGIVKSIVTIYFNEDFEYADRSEYEPEIGLLDFSALTLDDGDFSKESNLPDREFHPQGSNLNIAIKETESPQSLLKDQEIGDFETRMDPKYQTQGFSIVEREHTMDEDYPTRTKSSKAQWTVVDSNRILPSPESKCQAVKVGNDEDTKSNDGFEGPIDVADNTKLLVSKTVEEFQNSKKGHGDNRGDDESLCNHLHIQASGNINNYHSRDGLLCQDKESSSESSPFLNPLLAHDTDVSSTPSSPPIDVSIIYMKSKDDSVEPEEEADPDILEFIQHIVKKRSADDGNFPNSVESDGDLGFRESIEGGSNETFTSGESSVYDERFLGRTDIFRPLLTPTERKMLGIAIVPDFSVINPAESSEVDSGKVNCTANYGFEREPKMDSSASGYHNVSDMDDNSLIRSSRKSTLKRMFVNDFKIESSGLSKPHQTSTDSRRSRPGSHTELKYLRSISPYPENKSDLKRARDEVIQTIKWQSKLDKVAGDESWKAVSKSRIESVEVEYKILKNKIKEKASKESLRKLSLQYQHTEESLQARFINSREMLTNEFKRKVNKLNGEYSKQGYVLGTNFVKKSKKIEKKLMIEPKT